MQTVQYISNTFTGFTVPNFNGSTSQINVTQRGWFGPAGMPGTQLTNITDEHMKYLGNKLQELAYVYNYSR
jgi:hypothetical protein